MSWSVCSFRVKSYLRGVGQLWSELARLGPNSDLFWKRGPKKVWIGQQKSDFSAKVEYLTIRSEYEYGTFIPAGTLSNVKVVKLWKRVWFLPDFWSDFGLIFPKNGVWFRSEFGDVESDLTNGINWKKGVSIVQNKNEC